MFELIEIHPPLDVQETEYRRLLGYPKNRALEGRARELADLARQWYSENGRPWIYAREMGGLKLESGHVRLAGAAFSSRQMCGTFAEAAAHGAVLVAVSAGKECEEHARQLWQESKPDEYFFLAIFGSAVVEYLVTAASGRICSWADENRMAVLPHFSPGNSGWDIAEQTKLWNLFRQNANGHFPGELDVLESGMLRPQKSLLAVFGLTRELEKARRFAGLVPCESCSLPGCHFRRAAYSHSRFQFESVKSSI